jgi:thiosulfate reductase cytochrome b subunit
MDESPPLTESRPPSESPPSTESPPDPVVEAPLEPAELFAAEPSVTPAAPATPASPRRIYRHALATRIAHWIVAVCLPILAMSGLQIFNAHPHLYLGDRSDPKRAILSVDGGFPGWATLPGEQWLAMGRRWHFFFAWILVLTGLAFAVHSLASRHVTRDLVPWPRDLAGLGQSVRDHLRFRHRRGDAAARYNVLQKIAYTGVIFGLAPLAVLTGLAMSPGVDALAPWLVRVFGGRQSARTIHFVVTFAFVGFVLSHLFMIAITGVVNNVRSMITGWYRVSEHGGLEPHDRID